MDRSNANLPPTVNGLATAFTTEELSKVPYTWGPGAAPEVGTAVWHDFMPMALEAGKFQAKPDPQIIKGGLGGRGRCIIGRWGVLCHYLHP